jgi:hypothetical protein
LPNATIEKCSCCCLEIAAIERKRALQSVSIVLERTMVHDRMSLSPPLGTPIRPVRESFGRGTVAHWKEAAAAVSISTLKIQ